MTGTLRDLPEDLVSEIQRNAVASKLGERPADDPEDLRDLAERICRATGGKAPTLVRRRDDPGLFRLHHALRTVQKPKRIEVPIPDWPAVDRLEDPLDVTAPRRYDPRDVESLGKLVRDVHRIHARYDALREQVEAYNNRVESLLAPVGPADLDSYVADPGDDKLRRLIHGPAGVFNILAAALRRAALAVPEQVHVRDDSLRLDARLRDLHQLDRQQRRRLEELRDFMRFSEHVDHHLPRYGWNVDEIVVDYGPDEAIELKVRLDPEGQRSEVEP